MLKDPRALGTSPLNQENLEKMLEDGDEITSGVVLSKDRKLAFAGKGTYKLGEHAIKSFAKDGFVIATNFGLEGAEQMAKVASAFKRLPYIHGAEIEKTDSLLIQTVSGLDSGCDDGRLHLVGNSRGGGTLRPVGDGGDGRGGLAFGVSQSDEDD